MHTANRKYQSPTTTIVPVHGGYMMAMPGTGEGPGVGAPIRY